MDLVDSRFLHVWYTNDSVDSTDKTNGITPVAHFKRCVIQTQEFFTMLFPQLKIKGKSSEP